MVGYESGVSKELVSQVKVTTEVFNPHTSSPLFFITVMEQYSTIVMDTVVNGALCGQGGEGEGSASTLCACFRALISSSNRHDIIIFLP